MRGGDVQVDVRAFNVLISYSHTKVHLYLVAISVVVSILGASKPQIMTILYIQRLEWRVEPIACRARMTLRCHRCILDAKGS